MKLITLLLALVSSNVFAQLHYSSSLELLSLRSACYVAGDDYKMRAECLELGLDTLRFGGNYHSLAKKICTSMTVEKNVQCFVRVSRATPLSESVSACVANHTEVNTQYACLLQLVAGE